MAIQVNSGIDTPRHTTVLTIRSNLKQVHKRSPKRQAEEKHERCKQDTTQTSGLATKTSKLGWAYIISQCHKEELHKPWNNQQHETLACNSDMFRNAQRGWGMSCKEGYPIRLAVGRHGQLLQGNTPWASVNDHKSFKYIFEGPTGRPSVSTHARDRVGRWAVYLHTHTFDTCHIPGKLNRFADLLSRNGCATATDILKNETN